MRKQFFLKQSAHLADQLGGGHSKLAQTLLKIISETASPGPVAIVGPLGCGKSTVVELVAFGVREKLQDKGLVYIFDAWCHEQEPLRSAFMEGLIDSLTEKEWVSATKWSRISDLISGRATETVGERRSHFTWSAAVVLFLTISVTAAVNSVVKEGSLHDFPNFVKTTDFSILFAAVYLLLAAYVSTEELVKPKLSIFFRSEISTTQSRNILDTNSFEFQRQFRSLVEDALKDDPERTILIVLDNIDRTTEIDNSKLWSIMETFFDFSGQAKYFEQIWLIVPISLGDSRSNLVSDDKTKIRLDKDLITKFFAVQYRMPTLAHQPIFTYLEKLLEQVF